MNSSFSKQEAFVQQSSEGPQLFSLAGINQNLSLFVMGRICLILVRMIESSLVARLAFLLLTVKIMHFLLARNSLIFQFLLTFHYFPRALRI
jgi:hypothetical protein